MKRRTFIGLAGASLGALLITGPITDEQKKVYLSRLTVPMHVVPGDMIFFPNGRSIPISKQGYITCVAKLESGEFLVGDNSLYAELEPKSTIKPIHEI